MSGTFRVGIIKYINSIPLGYGVSSIADVVMDTPRRLAEMFSSGQLDVSFVPSVDYLRNTGVAHLVDGLSISSFGPTRSVKVCFSGELKKIRTVCLSPDSVTSNFLVKPILRHRYGLCPTFLDEAAGCVCDARLVIGDDGLMNGCGSYLDLGAEWGAMTGLPLVYAVCVARTKELAESFGPALIEVREKNLADLPAVLKRLNQLEWLEYLRGLDYRLEEPHHRSLEKIAAYLAEG